MLKREENMAKSREKLALKHMIAYERCMKIGVMLNR
jgi:hypothetical protein